jgi:hypothetical protein
VIIGSKKPYHPPYTPAVGGAFYKCSPSSLDRAAKKGSVVVERRLIQVLNWDLYGSSKDQDWF